MLCRFFIGCAALVLSGTQAPAQSIVRSQNGTLNYAIISQGNSANSVSLRQQGKRNFATGRQTGTSNSITFQQRGLTAEAHVNQSGSSNLSQIDQRRNQAAATSTAPTYGYQVVAGNGGTNYVTSYTNGGFDFLGITGAGTTSTGWFGRTH